jgi:hypothetical protein
MVGGDAEAVRRVDPIFAALAPGAAAGPPDRGRADERESSPLRNMAMFMPALPERVTSPRWFTTGSSMG